MFLSLFMGFLFVGSNYFGSSGVYGILYRCVFYFIQYNMNFRVLFYIIAIINNILIIYVDSESRYYHSLLFIHFFLALLIHIISHLLQHLLVYHLLLLRTHCSRNSFTTHILMLIKL